MPIRPYSVLCGTLRQRTHSSRGTKIVKQQRAELYPVRDAADIAPHFGKSFDLRASPMTARAHADWGSTETI
jgi:hypothetical protein